jgi:hypothetical protein
MYLELRTDSSPCRFGCRSNQMTHLSLANQYCEQAVTHDPSSKVTRNATWQGHDPRHLASTLTSLKITYLSFGGAVSYMNFNFRLFTMNT